MYHRKQKIRIIEIKVRGNKNIKICYLVKLMNFTKKLIYSLFSWSVNVNSVVLIV